MNPTHSVVQLAATGSQGNTAASLPQLWTNQGHGQVQILPPLPLEEPCQSNCSAVGASCVILDADTKKVSCLCPNGRILDNMDDFNPKCIDGKSCQLNFVVCIMKLNLTSTSQNCSLNKQYSLGIGAWKSG